MCRLLEGHAVERDDARWACRVSASGILQHTPHGEGLASACSMHVHIDAFEQHVG